MNCCEYVLQVSQHCRNVHANIQLSLHDAFDWPLERLSTVFGANAAGFPAKYMGCDQQPAGNKRAHLLNF